MLYGSTAKIKGMFNLKTFYNVLFVKIAKLLTRY